ncbi:hypothetical protein BC567DRAFT_235584 [Phyllosticta citribraziliensis]
MASTRSSCEEEVLDMADVEIRVALPGGAGLKASGQDVGHGGSSSARRSRLKRNGGDREVVSEPRSQPCGRRSPQEVGADEGDASALHSTPDRR